MRHDELRPVERPSLARGPGLEMIGLDVQHVGVARLIGSRQAERQPLAVAVETQRVDDAGERQLRGREILMGLQVDQAQLSQAALVGGVGEIVPVGGEREGLDIPGTARRHIDFLGGEEIDVAQFGVVAVPIRQHVDAGAVAREPGRGDRDLRRRGFHLALLPAAEIDDI
jgi:hypothetical protein